MKKTLLFILVILIAGTIEYAALVFSRPQQKVETAEVSIKGNIFTAEIAKNPERITRGLGGRKSMCDSCGMLFVFPSANKYSFWMKGMKFPLDIIWIQGNKIVYIAKNIYQNDLSIFHPPAEADKVLEINAGLSDRYSFGPGDPVIFQP